MSPADAALLLAVFLPFLAIPAIVALRSRPNPREAVSLAAAVATFALNAALVPGALSGTPASVVALQFYPGLAVAFRADALGLLFATVSSFLWILTTVYSIGYMRALKEHAQTRYYACFAAVMGSAMDVALSLDRSTTTVMRSVQPSPFRFPATRSTVYNLPVWAGAADLWGRRHRCSGGCRCDLTRVRTRDPA